MPICKNCHRTISKFDSDLCPYCGTENPIANDYETKDVTSFITATGSNTQLYKSKSRKTSAFLCLLLGEFGAHNFYLGFKKKAWIELFVTLFFIGGVGSVLFFLVPPFHNALGFLIPFFAVWLVYMGVSIHYFTKDSLEDANGVFLR